MSVGQRVDPYRNFRFRVEIDGIQTASFVNASVSDSSTDPIEYREGNEPPIYRKLSGLVKFGNITLKKGITDSLELYKWRKLVKDKGAAPARKNMSIILIDEEGKDKARWNIREAWPIKYQADEFNAKGNDVLIETLEIVHEGITRVS